MRDSGNERYASVSIANVVVIRCKSLSFCDATMGQRTLARVCCVGTMVPLLLLVVLLLLLSWLLPVDDDGRMVTLVLLSITCGGIMMHVGATLLLLLVVSPFDALTCVDNVGNDRVYSIIIPFIICACTICIRLFIHGNATVRYK